MLSTRRRRRHRRPSQVTVSPFAATAVATPSAARCRRRSRSRSPPRSSGRATRGRHGRKRRLRCTAAAKCASRRRSESSPRENSRRTTRHAVPTRLCRRRHITVAHQRGRRAAPAALRLGAADCGAPGRPQPTAAFRVDGGIYLAPQSTAIAADKKKESYRLRRCTQRTLSHSHSCTTRAWCETHRGAMTLLMHMFLAAGGRIMARSQTPRRSEASRSPITQRTRRPRQRSKARARFYVLLALIWIHIARSLIVTDPREDTRSPRPLPSPSPILLLDVHYESHRELFVLLG